MKKILSIFLTVMLIITMLPYDLLTLSASASKSGYYTYFRADGGGVVIASVDKSISGNVIVPSTLDGYRVTSITTNSFRNCDKITSITIPENITSIGYEAFCGCTSLTTINFNAAKCTLIGSLDKPAFSNCPNLTTINMGATVKSIPAYAFYGCESLTTVNITDLAAWCTIDFADSYSNPLCYAGNLYYKNQLITDLIIPDATERINSYAFYGGTSFDSVTIPSSITYVGENSFYGCTSLTAVCITDLAAWCNLNFALHSNPLYYAKRLCLNNQPITNLIIPDGITKIGEHAFEGCTSFISATVPNSVKSIAKGAFSGCSGLKNITLPFVGDCVKTENDNYQFSFGYIFGTSSYEGGSATEQAFRYSASNSSIQYTFYIPESLTTVTITGGNILNGAFRNCRFISNITMPEGITNIGSSAFSSCSALTSVTIPNSVKTIGASAFLNCSNLTDINIKNGITTIKDTAFGNCINLTNITIPESVTSIDDSSFSGCTKLVGIWVDENCKNYSTDNKGVLFNKNKTILIQAPAGITGDYIVPNGVNTITYTAFRSCKNLTNVTLPKSVSDIGGTPFLDCTTLRGIWVDENCEKYSNDSSGVLFNKDKTILIKVPEGFKGNYTVPYGTTEIKSSAFYSCNGLTGVTLHYGTTRINSYAFQLCANLTDIILPHSVTHISYGGFNGCDSLKNVWYTGNSTDKSNIEINYNNSALTFAEWHYNYLCAEHTYSSSCDVFCNMCNAERSNTSSHPYLNDCDTVCDSCGQERAIIHVYDNDCDNVCNVCEQTRTAPHYYEWVIDRNNNCGIDGIKHEECTVCHIKRNENTVIEAIGKHTFTNESDTQCNVCELEFIIIKFDYNGSMVLAQIKTLPNFSITLPTDIPLRSGYNFAGWATSKNGTAKYKAGGSFKSDKTITLYAQWNKRCSTCGGDKKANRDCSSCTNGYIKYYITCPFCKGSSLTCRECGSLSGCTNPTKHGLALCSRCDAGSYQTSERCSACSGVGYKEVTCTSCDSNGEVIRTDVSAPSAPLLESVSSTVVALQAIENGEYSIDGTNWQDNPIFYNLIEGRKYSFYQRYAKTDTTFTSASSIALKVLAHNHKFDNTCDTECNLCDYTREISHIYDSDCDSICNVCKVVRDTTTDHSYTNVCDYNCDRCGESREAPHTYDSDCDEVCNECLSTRPTNTNHTFDDIQDINCNKCGYTRILESILITSTPNKLSYLEGKDTLELTNGKITLFYNDGASGELDIDTYMISGFDNAKVGMQTLTVTYGGFEDAYEIEIIAKSITKISITSKPNKLTYTEGETFESNGMVVIAHYNNNTSKVITDYTVSGYDSTPGIKTITVIYEGKTAAFDVEVLKSYTPGDINDDGRVDLTDVVALAQYAAGWDVYYNENALDVNGDGFVNLTDVVHLSQYVAGWDVVLN